MLKLFSAFIGKETAKMEKASRIIRKISYISLFLAFVCIYNIVYSSSSMVYIWLILTLTIAWQTFSFSKKLNFVISVSRKAAVFADSADEVKNLSKEVYNGLKNGELDIEKVDEIALKSENIALGLHQTANDIDQTNIKL